MVIICEKIKQHQTTRNNKRQQIKKSCSMLSLVVLCCLTFVQRSRDVPLGCLPIQSPLARKTIV